MTSAVAISTTGHPHRLAYLGPTIAYWRAALAGNGAHASRPDQVYVTVDGDEAAFQRVLNAVGYEPVTFVRVGQPLEPALGKHVHKVRNGRLGVAVNKNTGLELLMDAGVEHLFLSDDDIYPLSEKALHLHMDFPPGHSMVCWGYHRLGWTHQGYAEWDWPRGSMLYVRRPVVGIVGGMIEAFGPGGHEHVEWSRRIHTAGITPALYPTPLAYAAESNRTGQTGMGAENFWHAVDMPLDGEHIGNYAQRKALITSVERDADDQRMIDDIMKWTKGSTAFVPYTAARNNRASATLYPAT